jgi:cytidylate kinase
MYLNEVSVETEIRTIEVLVLSKVAEVSEVRAKLVGTERNGKNKGIVMDGRDRNRSFSRCGT